MFIIMVYDVYESNTSDFDGIRNLYDGKKHLSLEISVGAMTWSHNLP